MNIEPTFDRILVAIADPTRRAILDRLARGSARVTDVAEPFDMSLAAVSKHVQVLERAGLVRRTRSGREPRSASTRGRSVRSCGGRRAPLVFNAWLNPKSPGALSFGIERAIVNTVVDVLFYHSVKHERFELPMVTGTGTAGRGTWTCWRSGSRR